MTRREKSKKKRKRNDQYKRGEIPLLQVFGKDMIEGKMKPKRRVLESQRAGTGVEAPGQLRLSSRDMLRTTAMALRTPTVACSWGNLLSLSHYRDETRENNFTIHPLPGNRDFINEPVTTRGRTGQQAKQAVRSRRMMRRRAARQTAAVLLFFLPGGGRSFGCLFFLFISCFSSSFSDSSGLKFC